LDALVTVIVIVVVVVVAVVIVVVVVVVVVVPVGAMPVERKDVNSIYGMYHRGWDGDGDYGDGDQMEMRDNNDYYGT
jgi:hypothetical protein